MLDIFNPKWNIKYPRLIIMNFNYRDLGSNPSQEGVFVAEQANDLKILQ